MALGTTMCPRFGKGLQPLGVAWVLLGPRTHSFICVLSRASDAVFVRNMSLFLPLAPSGGSIPILVIWVFHTFPAS